MSNEALPAGHYIRLETAISVLANTILVTALGLLIFGHTPQVGVWAVGGVEFDLVLQTSTVAFFSSLVPTLLTRRRVRRGKVAPGSKPLVRLPQGVFLQSLVVALIAIVIFLPSATALVLSHAPQTLSLWPFMALKIVLAILVAAFATVVALHSVLAGVPPAAASGGAN